MLLGIVLPFIFLYQPLVFAAGSRPLSNFRLLAFGLELVIRPFAILLVIILVFVFGQTFFGWFDAIRPLLDNIVFAQPVLGWYCSYSVICNRKILIICNQ